VEVEVEVEVLWLVRREMRWEGRCREGKSLDPPDTHSPTPRAIQKVIY
jgi:hypothetical protein